jgi:hypothetical protein
MATVIYAAMLRAFVLVAVLLLLIFSAKGADLPNARLTPGEANPVLTQKKICSPEFRTGPFRKVPASLKKKVYAAYGMTNHKGACAGKEGCELDHLQSLEIGGSNSAKNLWPQSYSGKFSAHVKDKLENCLHKLVCGGKISLEEAQAGISKNWIDMYQEYYGEGRTCEKSGK